MAGYNQFKPFAISVSSQLLTQAQWEDDTATSYRRIGQPFGRPLVAQLWNKALRQLTSGAAGTAQFIADENINAMDDGDYATLGESFGKAVKVLNGTTFSTILSNAVTSGTLLAPNGSHSQLTDRNVPGAHTISSITGLADELNDIQDAINELAERLPISTTEVKGISWTADQAEVAEGTNDYKFVTPFTAMRYTLATTQLPEMSASKITSGTIPATMLPSLPASTIASGTFDSQRIPELDASKFTSGKFNAARIPPIDLSKIPNLDTMIFTSGVFDVDRIPNITASMIETTTTFNVDRIPGLPAEKFTTGTFAASRLPSTLVYWGGVTGTLSSQSDLNSALSSKEIPTNLVTVVNSNSSDTKFPSAKAVKTYLDSIIPDRRWGDITGTLSDQSDIVSALSTKVDAQSTISTGKKTKVTYGSNGLITGGSLITADDIPNLDASKFTSGTFDESMIPISYDDKATVATSSNPFCISGSYNSAYTDSGWVYQSVCKTVGTMHQLTVIQNTGRLANNIIHLDGDDSYIDFLTGTFAEILANAATVTVSITGCFWRDGVGFVYILPGGNSYYFQNPLYPSTMRVYFKASGTMTTTETAYANSSAYAVRLNVTWVDSE